MSEQPTASFLQLIAQTTTDTDAAIMSLLTERHVLTAFQTIDDLARQERITYETVGPHAWDTDYSIDGELFLRRRVEGDHTAYYAVEPKGKAETVH